MIKYRKRPIKGSAVATRVGDYLSPIHPTLRLPEISERTRLRAKAFSLIRMDRIAIQVHQRMAAWLDSKEAQA